MLFNFAAYLHDGSTEFGLVTASDLDDARAFIQTQFGFDLVGLDVEPGAEQLIDEQYGGFALLGSAL